VEEAFILAFDFALIHFSVFTSQSYLCQGQD